jgi:hypothetical protein
MASANDTGFLAKYRDTPKFEEAFEIVAPASERREECEYDLALALTLIERETRLEKRELPPGENWRVLHRLPIC